MMTKDYEVWRSVHLRSIEGKKGKLTLSMQQGPWVSISDNGDAMGSILYLLVVITCTAISRVLGDVGEVRTLPVAVSNVLQVRVSVPESPSHLKRSKKLADALFVFHVLTTV